LSRDETFGLESERFRGGRYGLRAVDEGCLRARADGGFETGSREQIYVLVTGQVWRSRDTGQILPTTKWVRATNSNLHEKSKIKAMKKMNSVD